MGRSTIRDTGRKKVDKQQVVPGHSTISIAEKKTWKSGGASSTGPAQPGKPIDPGGLNARGDNRKGSLIDALPVIPAPQTNMDGPRTIAKGGQQAAPRAH
ncbi:unnamed protein product [Linum trigynum]|uniref:Uncharacterized protein n=1 Tax=Linum trigynum TaxID=586398 RepID=A0AAV2ERW8_9ROSI